jgi:phosphate-selective porin
MAIPPVAIAQVATNESSFFRGLQQVYSLSLGWYPNDHLRFLLQFSHVDVDRLDAPGTTRIGQDFETIAQVAF